MTTEIIAFNSSPRHEWNTATLLKNALKGAASKGARTELINLYDLDYYFLWIAKKHSKWACV